MARKTVVQSYLRDADGFLIESELQPHMRRLSEQELAGVIADAIAYANQKSSRAILNVQEDTPAPQVLAEYRKSGVGLFQYFLHYCGDPASTAHQCYGQHYREVAKEQFRNRTLQKERMNSGWRYQYIAKDAASRSGRFISVSDIGTAEADFNASIRYRTDRGVLTIYVSVKNRTNTMGGQDWPKAILALENVAITDKNRQGHFLCVFGIAMEKGDRLIKSNQKTGVPHSSNTEIWKSDFFWPFFTNLTYEEIMRAVLRVLISTQKSEMVDVPIPDELLESFGDCCRKASLLDDEGRFNDPYKLVSLFCGARR